MELDWPTRVGDALSRADDEDALASYLTSHGVPEPWLLAPALVGAGADTSWCERVEVAVGRDGLGAALAWVASTAATTTLLAELKLSIGRISELVGAVKSFSQMDRGSRQRIDLREGIEAGLVVLGHKLGAGVTVVRDYAADTPEIEAYAGELNQVWANLVDNALDAMDGSGTLRISTRPEGTTVVVEIEDTGPGMTREVAARAFEAFYTTKDVGKGTGLGLDIVRRIVEERHGGTVIIDSRPGHTVLRVCLPVASGSSLPD
jgi:signal transduction histidine kinase